MPLIRSAPVIAAVHFLERSGAPAARILEAVRLPRAALSDREMLLPLHLCGLFAARAAHSQGLDDFGLRFGAEIPLAGLGRFGGLLAQAQTLAEACELATRTRELFNSGARMWFACDGQRVWFHQALDPRIEHGRRELEQAWAIQVLQLIRRVAGNAPVPFELHLRAPAARAVEDHALLADVDVRFARAATGVAFPAALLGWPLPRPGPMRPRVEFEARLAASRPAADFVASVRQVTGALLEQGYPDLQRVADAIGLSARTLQRRLAESGASHSRLVESERLTRAVALLRVESSTVTGIALALGYRDLSTFTHAFRRWTGASPRAFRRRIAASTLRVPSAAAEGAAAQ